MFSKLQVIMTLGGYVNNSKQTTHYVYVYASIRRCPQESVRLL